MCLCWHCKKKKFKKKEKSVSHEEEIIRIHLGLSCFFAVTSAIKRCCPKKTLPWNTRRDCNLISFLLTRSLRLRQSHIFFFCWWHAPPCHQLELTHCYWDSYPESASIGVEYINANVDRGVWPQLLLPLPEHAALLLQRAHICHSNTDAQVCMHHKKIIQLSRVYSIGT